MMLGLLRPRSVMPVHGEFRMLAAHARLARDAGVPAERIVTAENGDVVELSAAGIAIVDRVEAGIAFVDGLADRRPQGRALRDRRHLAEDGVLIVVATIGSQNGREIAAPEVIARGFAEPETVLDEARDEAEAVLRRCLSQGITELKLLQEHLHDALGQLIHERTRQAADDPARRARGLMAVLGRRRRVLRGIARRRPARLVSALRACEVASLAFCRLLDCWARGSRAPRTAGQRQAALRRAAERAETAVAGLERPLDRYLLELEPEVAEGRAVVRRARAGRALRMGAGASPRRGGRSSASGRAGLPRACGASSVRSRGWRRRLVSPPHPDRTSLWAGFFDLRENLGGAADDLRALAA